VAAAAASLLILGGFVASGCSPIAATSSTSSSTSSIRVASAETAISTTGVTYYVAPTGADSNAGTAPTKAWRTLDKVNRTTLRPGDQVRFLKGGTWSGKLELVNSGTATAPITVGNYGTASALPKVTGGVLGDCIRVRGDYVHVTGLAASACVYAGINIFGKHDRVTYSQVSNNKVGIKVTTAGAAFGSFQHNTLTNNNRMTVLTKGTNCGTALAKNCGDDSGATAFLLNSDNNDIGFNTVTGSNAFSYDNFGRDGSAFEIFNGNNNIIHDNVSIDNFALSEIGRSGSRTADGNVFRNNTVTATCGANCTYAFGIILRGSQEAYGPNRGTVIDGNRMKLVGSNTKGITCFASCPSSTVVTNNVITASFRALWMDGSGWTVRGNELHGQTIAQVGGTRRVVPSGTQITW
jgi:hypothetical protein